RMVSDPRASSLERRMAHLLRLAVINRYDPSGWNCTDMPPAPGETPVGGGVFIKQRCEKFRPKRASWSKHASCASPAKTRSTLRPAKPRLASSKAGPASRSWTRATASRDALRCDSHPWNLRHEVHEAQPPRRLPRRRRVRIGIAGGGDMLVMQHPDEDAVGDRTRQVRLSRELHHRRERRRGEYRRDRRR